MLCPTSHCWSVTESGPAPRSFDFTVQGSKEGVWLHDWTRIPQAGAPIYDPHLDLGTWARCSVWDTSLRGDWKDR